MKMLTQEECALGLPRDYKYQLQFNDLGDVIKNITVN